LVLKIPLDLNEQSSANEEGFDRVTVEIFDAHLLIPSTLHDACYATASLRSLLLICIFKEALACLASMQMTGSPSLLSSVLHNQISSLEHHLSDKTRRPFCSRPFPGSRSSR
jgi:hypothetical protein